MDCSTVMKWLISAICIAISFVFAFVNMIKFPIIVIASFVVKIDDILQLSNKLHVFSKPILGQYLCLYMASLGVIKLSIHVWKYVFEWKQNQTHNDIFICISSCQQNIVCFKDR